MRRAHRLGLSERQRYIARHGVVPWGLLAGAGAAAAVVWSATGEPVVGVPVDRVTLVALGVLCFITWAGIAGWAVGAFLWETRGRNEPPKPRRAKPPA